MVINIIIMVIIPKGQSLYLIITYMELTYNTGGVFLKSPCTCHLLRFIRLLKTHGREDKNINILKIVF